MKTDTAWILASALLATVTLTSCGGERAAPTAVPEAVRGLEVVTVQAEPVPDWLEAVGTVRAAQTAEIGSQLLATIVEVRVREGDSVRRGQVLAVLDDLQTRAAFDRAEAALAASDREAAAAQAEAQLAATTFQRYQTLYARKSVSPQEFDEARTRAEAAAARRESAEANREQARAARAQTQVILGHTRLRAPFNGWVTEKRADPGTLASPGTVILVVEDTRRFRLEASVDESAIAVVRSGQEVPVVVDALGNEELRGRVTQIVPAADPGSRSFLVKVELPADRRLRSGLFGRARFTRGEREAMLVPATAVVRRGQLEGLYVIGADSLIALRYVTLGKSRGSRIEVLSGLAAGERVITAPGERELAGKRLAEDAR